MASRRSLRPATWTGIALVALIALVVVVLATLALQRPSSSPPGSEVAPVPTFDLGVSSSPSPRPTGSSPPTGQDDPDPVARSAERFLAVGAGGVMWRGVGGSCSDGAEPLIERSIDDGATWNDVTPFYRGITQLAGIEATDATQATIVAAVGAECETQALRTFTDGEFWESYDDVLAASTFLSPADSAQVVLPGASIQTPCSEARGLRDANGQVALICNSEAQGLVDGEWMALGVSHATAVAVIDGGFVVAHTSDDCEGVALSTVQVGADPTPAGCAGDLDPTSATAIAVAVDTGDVVVWNGDDVARVTLDG